MIEIEISMEDDDRHSAIIPNLIKRSFKIATESITSDGMDNTRGMEFKDINIFCNHAETLFRIHDVYNTKQLNPNATFK